MSWLWQEQRRTEGVDDGGAAGGTEVSPSHHHGRQATGRPTLHQTGNSS